MNGDPELAERRSQRLQLRFDLLPVLFVKKCQALQRVSIKGIACMTSCNRDARECSVGIQLSISQASHNSLREMSAVRGSAG